MSITRVITYINKDTYTQGHPRKLKLKIKTIPVHESIVRLDLDSSLSHQGSMNGDTETRSVS